MKKKASPQLLEMNEAIALLKTTRPTFYRWVRAGKLTGTKVGRQWRFKRSEIERFLKGEAPQIDLPADIQPLLSILALRLRQPEAPRPQEGKVARAVRLMIQVVIEARATDLHLDPGIENAVARCRIDGVLHPMASFDSRLLPAVIRQWKTMANCDVHESARPQDGRIRAELENRKIDLRLCFVPAALGESLTVRVLDQETAQISIERFNYGETDRKKLEKSFSLAQGMIVVTGPMGSGKTSALYACLNHIAATSAGRKIMTIEDPVEYLLPGTTQVAVRSQMELTFAGLLRACLRSDPDVILVGEIRDRETLVVTQQAAVTGHLVLTSLHTSEAATALRRMIDIGANSYVTAEATRLVLAQRLVRGLCPKCSAARRPARHLLTLAHRLARLSALDWKPSARKFREPVGCKHCHMTGFRGRIVIAETLEMTPKINSALMRNASAAELRSIAVSEGMSTLAADGLRRVDEGKTSLGEILLWASSIYAAELSAKS